MEQSAARVPGIISVASIALLVVVIVIMLGLRLWVIGPVKKATKQVDELVAQMQIIIRAITEGCGQMEEKQADIISNVEKVNATADHTMRNLGVMSRGMQQEMKDISYAVEELAASAGQLKESIRCFTVV